MSRIYPMLVVASLSFMSVGAFAASPVTADNQQLTEVSSRWQRLNPFTKDALPSSQVAEPFIDMRTGPGKGFPVFYTATRGDWIEIIKRRTHWYKVRVEDGTTGWVHLDALQLTIEPNGRTVDIDDGSIKTYQSRRWETGIFVGNLEGAPLLAVSAGWLFTPNLGLEINSSDVIGDFSDSLLVTLGLVHQPLPYKRFSPFITVAVGKIAIEPSATLVLAADRQDDTVSAGAGIKIYLHRSLVLRLDYRNHVILTSREQNEEIEEWKAGLAVFW